MQYGIVLDVGGTGIKGALYTNKNLVSKIREYPAHSDGEKDFLINHLCSICEDLLSISGEMNAVCNEICFAFPGPFDYEKGIPLMKGLGKYEQIYGVILPKVMSENWINRGVSAFENLTWSFINDVTAFALSANKKFQLTGRTMCVCIGTGCGSSFLIDGKLCIDRVEGVPENGWIFPLPFGETIIDNVLSARGISKIAEQYCKISFSPIELSERALSGDAAAIASWEYFGSLIEKGLTPIISNFCADTLVLGGKIARSAGLFITPLSNWCSENGIRLVVEPDTSETIFSWIYV